MSETTPDPKIASFIMLAEQAANANNSAEALTYFNKVIELDPLNPEAWLGKGIATGWLSTPANVRLLEMGQAIKNAIQFAPEEQKVALNIRGALGIMAVADALHSVAWNFLQKNISLENGREFLNIHEDVLAALEFAHSLNPKSIQVMERIVAIASYAGGVVGGSGEKKARAKALGPKYEAMIKELDPNYVPPQSSSCFVVTATLGSEDNIFVSDLRSFRESSLRRWAAGRAFISWYYEYGPTYAEVIRQSIFLRFAAFCLVVLPAYLIAKPILLFKNIGKKANKCNSPR